MSEYVVYINWNGGECLSAVEVSINATVGALLNNINTNKLVVFGDVKLNSLPSDTSLADIGLGPQSTLFVEPFISFELFAAMWFDFIKHIWHLKPDAYIFYINPNLTAKVVIENPDEPWVYEKIYRYSKAYSVIEFMPSATTANWGMVSCNKNIDLNFIKRNLDKPLTFVKLLDTVLVNDLVHICPPYVNSWELASKNHLLSLELVQKYIDEPWDYCSMTTQNWNEHFIDVFSNKPIKWSIMHIYVKSLEIIEKYIKKPWNWYEISKMAYLTIDFVKKYPHLYWSHKKLQENKHLSGLDLKTIKELKMVLHWDSISRYHKITLDILKEHHEQPWNWTELSRNTNITMEIINNFINRPWKWRYLTENPSITDENKRTFSDLKIWKWKLSEYEKRRLYSVSNDASIRPCGDDAFISLTFEKVLEMVSDEDRKYANQQLNFMHRDEIMCEFIIKYPDIPWTIKQYSGCEYLPVKVIEKYSNTVCFKSITIMNRHIEEIAEKFPEKVVWRTVTRNKNITLPFIRKYREKIRDIENIYAYFENTEEFVAEFPLTHYSRTLIGNPNISMAALRQCMLFGDVRNYIDELFKLKFTYDRKRLCGF